VTLIIWRRFWRVEVQPLEQRVEFSQSDIMLVFSIIIDAMQYIAMGPNISAWAYMLFFIGSAASMNLDDFIDLKNGVFWIAIDVTFGVSFLLLLLYLFNTFMLKGVLPSSGILANIKSLSDMALPMIGNVLFLPIMSTLLEVFICTETSGDDIEDAFLHKD
jgi:hypothetical protein